VPLQRLRVAVQEYGASNPDLLDGLRSRGAQVTAVPVYQWALPEDLEPLKAGIRALIADDVDVVMFTAATQVAHLMEVAGRMNLAGLLREKLGNVVVASIGPTTSEELRQNGVKVDMEPSHPKMGFLVREAAECAEELLKAKRAS
jgi:uroporphyrinogen-III synthase